MKIAILNAKYSRNLGDGAIAECLEHQLAKRIAGSTVISVDVAGSTDYGGSNSMITPGMESGFKLLPEWVLRGMRYTLRPLMVRRRYAPAWKQALSDCNAIVIGGGQLLMDVQRYFPTRISIAIESARPGIPLFVCSVGVSKELTAFGKKLFENAFRHGRFVSATVRDGRSLENWKAHFPRLPAEVAYDPALLSFDTYAGRLVKILPVEEGRKVVALGVSDPSNMKAHADNPAALVGGDPDFYIQIVHQLIAAGYRVVIFNNGDDTKHMELVVAALSASGTDLSGAVTVMPNPDKPVDLISQINSADVVVSHRLHANILSYSYRIPSVGLMWDQKVENFFELTGRREFLVTESRPATVVEKVELALSTGVNPERYAQVVGDATKGLDLLAQALVRESASSAALKAG